MIRSDSTLTPQGAWEVKRRFTLPTMALEGDARLVAQHLAQVPGICATQMDTGRQRLTVVYDARRLDYRQVLAALADTGFPAPESWWRNVRTYWFQYLDETGRENANAPEAPCCSHPQGTSQPQRQRGKG